jgi:hypothetical protein
MCNGQRTIKSLQKVIVSMMPQILAQSKECKSMKIIESMIASKEPDHSLGATPIGSAGRAPDERKEEREEIFYAG